MAVDTHSGVCPTTRVAGWLRSGPGVPRRSSDAARRGRPPTWASGRLDQSRVPLLGTGPATQSLLSEEMADGPDAE
jgi:hypothetical protein